MRQLMITLCTVLALAGCASSRGSISKAGSMSRFALRGNQLYTLAGRKLVVYDVRKPADPTLQTTVKVPDGAETLFLQNALLYLGARSGMYIYSLRYPAQPRYLGGNRHFVSCDPVVVRGSIAFVTLRSGRTWCPRGSNVLQIYDVANPTKPRLLHSYRLTQPTGLGIDGDLLFVTDGKAGLRIYDARNPLKLQLLQQFTEINGYDVIPNDGILIISAETGLYQLDYRRRRFRLLSKIPIRR